MNTGPIYKFKGRSYSTIVGLSRALFIDSGCDSHSMVDSTRHITCWRGRGTNREIIAQYLVDVPKLGEPIHVLKTYPVQP